MARDSDCLRSVDLRAIYLLVGECCELGADPIVWRVHLLNSLSDRFGATGAADIGVNLPPTNGFASVHPSTALCVDYLPRAQRTVMQRCVREMPFDGNPLGMRLLPRLMKRGAAAAVRPELLGKPAWQKSVFMTEFLAPVGWNELLLGMIGSPAGVRVMCFSRDHGETPFQRRSSRMLELLMREMAAVPPGRLSSFREASLAALPLRLRDVLSALAEGDNEKQIALRLGISRNTVHEYVRRLFRRFGVASRSALLLRAARQIHARSIVNTADDGRYWTHEHAAS